MSHKARTSRRPSRNGHLSAEPELVRLEEVDQAVLHPVAERAASARAILLSSQQDLQQAQQRAASAQSDFRDAIGRVDGAIEGVLRMRRLNPEDYTVAFDLSTQAILIRPRAPN